MKVRYSYGLLFVLLSMGCMVGKKYTKQPVDTDVAYRYNINYDTSILKSWYDIYHDTVLLTIIKQTLDSNYDLLTAAARIEEARAQVAVVRANLYPQFGYTGQAGGGTAGVDALKVASGVQGGLFNALGTLNWELDVWGKLRHAKRSAVAQFLATTQNRNALVASLVADAASSYFLLADLDNRLNVARRTVIARKENTRVISERFNKGYVAEIDKLQAIQQETIAAATIPLLERQVVLVENSLRVLMGLGPGKIDRGQSNFDQQLSPVPVGLPSQLLERRPDIMEAEQLMAAQFELIGVAQANRFPTISLTGLLSFASPELGTFLTNKGFVANGFANITGPIFTFHQRKKLVEVEQRRFEQTYYQYRKTVLLAFADVDNALALYKTYTDEYEQRQIEVDAATKALRLSRARYDNGYTSYTEVILIENNLFDAEFQASQTLQGKLNSVVLLYKALGGGW